MILTKQGARRPFVLIFVKMVSSGPKLNSLTLSLSNTLLYSTLNNSIFFDVKLISYLAFYRLLNTCFFFSSIFYSPGVVLVFGHIFCPFKSLR